MNRKHTLLTILIGYCFFLPLFGQSFPDAIKLSAFIDSNSNGERDAGETLLSGGTFLCKQSGMPSLRIFDSGDGAYLYPTGNSDSYEVSYRVNPEHAVKSNAGGSTSKILTLTPGSEYFIPVQALPVQDLKINIFGGYCSAPRAGAIYRMTVVVRNNGQSVVPVADVTFNHDSTVTIPTLPGSATYIEQGFAYVMTNLLPNEQRYIYVEMLVADLPQVSLGQMVQVTASVTPLLGDHYPANNFARDHQGIVAAYDPNEKKESHGGIIHMEEFSQNEVLVYTILFENLGNASALNINIVDELDALLDETSVLMIASSHNFTMSGNGKTLQWKANGINLPPSIPDTVIGKGYIVFQVKPHPGISAGDVILNSADILFDTNPPITTNTVHTQFVAPLGTFPDQASQAVLYPNPTSGPLFFSGITSVNQIVVTDTSGRVVGKNTNMNQVDISDLPAGAYFVQLQTNDFQKVFKVFRRN